MCTHSSGVFAPLPCTVYLVMVKNSAIFILIFLERVCNFHLFVIFRINFYNTRYTVHGRGAKHYFHPCVQTRLDVQNDEPPADGLRQITSVRGKLSKDSISGRIWRVHAFVIFLQKNAKSGSEKRSLNRLIPALNFINERSTFGFFKIKVQTTSRQ